MFQSAKQITGFPKMSPTPGATSTVFLFQSAKQITGFPKAVPDFVICALSVVSICQADYWLPQGLSTAPPWCVLRNVSICQADYWLPQVITNPDDAKDPWYVSICQADYWLPQVLVTTAPAWYTGAFQSAKQITGFPKAARRARRKPPTSFNLPSRLLASPRACPAK